MAKGRTGRDWDGQNRANIDKYTRQIKSLFNSIAGEAALIGSSVDTVNPDRLFTFADYPKTKQRADKLISNLQNDLNTIIVNGVRSSWTLSNNKNNELAQQVFGNNVGKLSKAEYRRYFNNNGVALDQFINRKENGLNLSDRVWRYSQQFKKEIEMGLDLGIGNGLSADQMARDLKQYLQFPDKLFRRVRDKHGELQLSKAAQAFHPGAGVYRSSYKNAMRLSRTENNMAYRASDHERWNEFDFVVGFEIRLSNNPNHCPMCEALAGKYPKTFKFVGWHPQCRCAAIPILKTPDELEAEVKRILIGEPAGTDSGNKISNLPPAFNNWYADNKTRLERAASKPYWLRDNKRLVASNTELPMESLAPVLSLIEIKELIQRNAITKDIFSGVTERGKLHDKIIKDYFNTTKVESDMVYMLGGAPANGKSTLTNSGKLPHPKGALVIDADRVKSMIPEYKAMINSGDKALIKKAANFVHEESGVIVKRIKEKAMLENWGSVVDGVNDGTAEKIHSNAMLLKKLSGKKIRADYVTIDTDLSIKLAEQRAEKTGRAVPIEFIKEMNTAISKEFETVLKNKSFDELYLWDTNINGKPRLVLSQINGKVRVFDKALYQKFLKKAN